MRVGRCGDRSYLPIWIYSMTLWKWTMNEKKNKQIKAFKLYYNLCPIFCVVFCSCFVQFSILFFCITLRFNKFFCFFHAIWWAHFLQCLKIRIFWWKFSCYTHCCEFLPLTPLIPDFTSYFYFILTKCQNFFCWHLFFFSRLLLWCAMDVN